MALSGFMHYVYFYLLIVFLYLYDTRLDGATLQCVPHILDGTSGALVIIWFVLFRVSVSIDGFVQLLYHYCTSLLYLALIIHCTYMTAGTQYT